MKNEKVKSPLVIEGIILLLLLFPGLSLFPGPTSSSFYAGFRASRYGIQPFPGKESWTEMGHRLGEKIGGVPAGAIWIVGEITDDNQCLLNFPSPGGVYQDIEFLDIDQNEEYFSWFDDHNIFVWLQVEPGNALAADLIDIVLNRYKHHPCVKGFGIDVEWYKPGLYSQGKPVTDKEAQAWSNKVILHNSTYTLFLKHWLISKMPKTYRNNLFFINDSQEFPALDKMVEEFETWGSHFAPHPVGFQFGYEADRPWWSVFNDPFQEIGRGIIAKISNTYGLFWVDFTIKEIFPTTSFTLSPQVLNFGATSSGHFTSSQHFTISNNGGGTLEWTITDYAYWLSCTPTSGTTPGVVTVSIDPSGLSAGSHTGTITVTDPFAGNSSRLVTVYLEVYGPGESSPVFGSFDSPVEGTAGVTGSLPVSGWALDDIEVDSVKIYFAAGGNLVYIGDAVFVEGARPDVEQSFPGYPFRSRAGWGYMLLTNYLPNQGNGTFILYAVAVDKEGNSATLGIKTIACDNANAVKPFGTIDTPVQGGTASGSRYINWGWVLTPWPNSIPADGSTISVYVDGINLGHPIYNIYRSDIAELFPGYANSNGAIGYFYLDTSSYENGVHTIQWVVEDDAGNTDGIGSRYFIIQNTSTPGAR